MPAARTMKRCVLFLLAAVTLVPIVETAPAPSAVPTPVPYPVPSPRPTPRPSISSVPSSVPIPAPSPVPTLQPTKVPYPAPSLWPTPRPSLTPAPSSVPIPAPTRTFRPTSYPSISPRPTPEPTSAPTSLPSLNPTKPPTLDPTNEPTLSVEPSSLPTIVPTRSPSLLPTAFPTAVPTGQGPEETAVAWELNTAGSREGTYGTSCFLDGTAADIFVGTLSALPDTYSPNADATFVLSGRDSALFEIRDTNKLYTNAIITHAATSGSIIITLTATNSNPTTQRPGTTFYLCVGTYADDEQWDASGVGPQGGSHYPSGVPTLVPTPAPSLVPTSGPTSLPTLVPTHLPTSEPTAEPTLFPTFEPSPQPTSLPTDEPSAHPTGMPTGEPTPLPSSEPSAVPTEVPTLQPSPVPTEVPTGEPSGLPSSAPTSAPTAFPSGVPTGEPTGEPTAEPSGTPTGMPTYAPTAVPTHAPTAVPSMMPTSAPTAVPTGEPSGVPTAEPTGEPTLEPSPSPSIEPSGLPTALPTLVPTALPSGMPTLEPTPMPTPQTSDDVFDIANISFWPNKARVPQDININMKIWAKVEVGDYVIIGLPWFTSSGCDPTVKGKDLTRDNFLVWDNTRNSINKDNMWGNSSNTPGWYATWQEGDVAQEYADSKLILRPTRQIPWRQLQYLTIDAESNLMSCVGVPLSVSKNIIIPENTVKHNFTIYGLFQNISVWQGLHDHEDLVVMNPGTTYIKNGKYIYRQVPNRQNLPVLNEINGTGYAHSSKLTFGTNAGPIFKFGPHDESGKPGRMEYDGTELIFRVTLGMTLKPGDNITLMLPYFSNSPNPYNFRDQGVDKYGRIGDEVFIYDACSEEPSERSALCNRTQNHNYDLLNMFDLTKDTRAKALYREGYTPIGGGDLVNSHGDGEFNLRDLHLNSTLTFTMVQAWSAGVELAIGVHRKNNISATCQFFADDPQFQMKVDTGYNWTSMPWASIQSVESLGNGLGCDDQCGGHGACKVDKQCLLYCECEEGYGFPVGGAHGGPDNGEGKFGLESARQDCSKRICPKDYSFAALANFAANRSFTLDAHRPMECSDAGLCDRSSGTCECFDGFSGMACEYRTCPSGGSSGAPSDGDGGGGDSSGAVCSGHGRCLPMKYLAAQPDALPLSDTGSNVSIYFEDRRLLAGQLHTINDYTSADQVKAHQVRDAWDARMISGCLCDSSWPVGLGNGETQEPEWFGPDCSLHHCPSNFDPLIAGNETDCFNVTAAGGRGVGKRGNKCHVDCSNRGRCDYTKGTCECFEGFFGHDCHQTALEGKTTSTNFLEQTHYSTAASRTQAAAEAYTSSLAYSSPFVVGSTV